MSLKRKKLEDLKGAVTKELTQLIDTANAPIFGIDKNGNINEWNQKTEEITGYSKEEALKKPLVKTFITKAQAVFDSVAPNLDQHSIVVLTKATEQANRWEYLKNEMKVYILTI